MIGKVIPAGTLTLRRLRGGSLSAVPDRELSFLEILKYGFPWPGLSAEVFWWRARNVPNLWRGMWRVLTARFFGLPTFYGQVSLVRIDRHGHETHFGLASLRVVTTAGVNFLVDAFQNTTELENLKFHGFGTGTNAEAVGDTALQTELTTQYAADNTRPTGTTTEGASANIYRTVATLSPDTGGTIAITEHGVFSQAATGGGTLWDRSVFSAVNIVAASDSLQATYDSTFPSGG